MAMTKSADKHYAQRLYVGISDARKHLSDLVARSGYAGDRFVIERNGKPLAALISVDDFELFERLFEQHEDRLDAENVAAARAEQAGEQNVALADLAAELGIEFDELDDDEPDPEYVIARTEPGEPRSDSGRVRKTIDDVAKLTSRASDTGWPKKRGPKKSGA